MRAIKATGMIVFCIAMILIGAICFNLYLENSVIENDFNQVKAKLLLLVSFVGMAGSIMILSFKETAQIILGQSNQSI